MQWLYNLEIPLSDFVFGPSMTPMTVDNVRSQKRNSTTADFDLPPTKKQYIRHGRHHKLTWRPDETIRRQLPAQNEESAQTLLTRSIAFALEAVGFQGADPVAIESFRAETEECTAITLIAIQA